MIYRGLTKVKFLIFFLTLSLTGLVPLFSLDGALTKNLDAVFSSRGRGNYLPLRDQVNSLFQNLEDEKIPAAILFEKVKEGMAKKIPPLRLIEALKRETEIIIRARNLLTESGYLSTQWNDDVVSLLKGTVIVLRTGFPEDLAGNILNDAGRTGKPPSSAMFLLNSLFQIREMSILESREIEELGTTLSESVIPPSSYETIGAVFLKNRMKGMTDSELMLIIENIIRNGGGIIQIEQELNKRTGIR